MLKNTLLKIISNIRMAIGFTLITINTIFIGVLFYPVGLLKKHIHNLTLSKYCLKYLHYVGTLWIKINYLIVKIVSGVKMQVTGIEKVENLPMDTWYLLLSNHQSWNDVLILQFAFYKHLPFQKYLVKEKMRKFPIMGFVWEAIDCPFLKRKNLSEFNDTKNDNSRNTSDIDLIKKMSKKFKILPATIVSFIEGTRFSSLKHSEQASPFKNLLKPKSGGIAAILEELHNEITAIIDVSVCYIPRKLSFKDLFSGNINKIHVDINVFPIPEWLLKEYSTNKNYADYKKKFELWINNMWENKDKLITEKCYN